MRTQVKDVHESAVVPDVIRYASAIAVSIVSFGSNRRRVARLVMKASRYSCAFRELASECRRERRADRGNDVPTIAVADRKLHLRADVVEQRFVTHRIAPPAYRIAANALSLLTPMPLTAKIAP
jgi:hypothetical protein